MSHRPALYNLGSGGQAPRRTRRWGDSAKPLHRRQRSNRPTTFACPGRPLRPPVRAPSRVASRACPAGRAGMLADWLAVGLVGRLAGRRGAGQASACRPARRPALLPAGRIACHLRLPAFLLGPFPARPPLSPRVGGPAYGCALWPVVFGVGFRFRLLVRPPLRVPRRGKPCSPETAPSAFVAPTGPVQSGFGGASADGGRVGYHGVKPGTPSPECGSCGSQPSGVNRASQSRFPSLPAFHVLWCRHLARSPPSQEGG